LAGKHHFLSETLAGEAVGLHQGSETRWSIRSGPVEEH
jgi:hypothetical protein